MPNGRPPRPEPACVLLLDVIRTVLQDLELVSTLRQRYPVRQDLQDLEAFLLTELDRLDAAVP